MFNHIARSMLPLCVFPSFSNMCVALLILVCILGELKIELLSMLIPIFVGDFDKRRSVIGHLFTMYN